MSDPLDELRSLQEKINHPAIAAAIAKIEHLEGRVKELGALLRLLSTYGISVMDLVQDGEPSAYRVTFDKNEVWRVTINPLPRTVVACG